MKILLALFQSTRAVIKAERLCEQNNIRCKVIPVPRDLSSECGMALEIPDEDIARAQEVFAREGLKVKFHKRN